MTCAEVDELAGAIALDAIPEEEWPAIREHLATCTRGHPEVQDLRRVATLLLEAAPPIEPPAGLRDRILAAARAEPAVPAPLGPAGTGPMPFPAAPAEVGEERDSPTIIRRTERAWWARPSWAAAAAVLIAAALALWNVSLQGELNDTEDRLASAERQVALQELALAAVAGRGQQVPLTSSLPGATGTVLRPDSGTATLVIEGLPQAQDRIYQVWAIQGDQPVSLGVFAPDDAGVKVFALDHDLHNVDAVAITLEPAPNGSARPTASPILIAPLRG
jgi:hypothetical protein